MSDTVIPPLRADTFEHISESQQITRIREFPSDIPLDILVRHFRRLHLTGRLEIHLGNGGISAIRFHEEYKF